MAELTFDATHLGDVIRLQDHEGGWMSPLRLFTDPGPCQDKCCGACACKGLTIPDGRKVPVHALGSTRVQVLDSLTPAAPATPGREVDTGSEHSQTGGRP